MAQLVQRGLAGDNENRLQQHRRNLGQCQWCDMFAAQSSSRMGRSTVCHHSQVIAGACVSAAGVSACSKVFSADEVADTVIGILDKLGVKEACVVGHSYGKQGSSC